MIFGEYQTEHQYNRTSSDTLHDALGRMAGAAAAQLLRQRSPLRSRRTVLGLDRLPSPQRRMTFHTVHCVRTAANAVHLSRCTCSCGCRLAIAAAAVHYEYLQKLWFVISAFLKICLETLGGEGSKHIRMWLIFWTRQNGGEDTPVLTIS